MNHNTSLGEKKADMADTDLSNIDVVLNPRSKEHCEIPPEFPDPLNLPSLGSRSLENKKFQGTDHQQVQNVECSKRHGTVCIVGTSSRKVEAPRNGSESTKVPDKEDPQISKTEGIQADNSRKKVLQNLVIRDDTLQDIWQDFIEGKGAENPSSPIPSDEFVASRAIYGTGNALTKLALSHEELKTGRHGVYTDLRYAQIILRNHEDEQSLGSGSFGVVTKDKGPNGLEYVRKRIKEKFHPTEAIFTNSANHPNIIKSFGLMLNSGSAELIMDFAGQSLQSLVSTESLDEDIILSLTLDICRGLVFLETKNVVHLDIKPSNLFVQVDDRKEYRLKIGDFGSARMPEEKKEKIAWTPQYGAPELAQLHLKKKSIDKMQRKPIQKSMEELKLRLQPKTDMFSFGLVVGFMYTEKHLLFELVPKEEPSFSHKLNIFINMKRILQRMLQFDVEERSSATDSMKLLKALLPTIGKNTSLLEMSFEGSGDKIKTGNVLKKEELHSLAPQAFLLTDDQLEGFQTKEKIGLPTHGYQTGAFMQGDQIRSSTKGNTQEFNQASLPLEQPMHGVHISKNSYPICQAADDLTVKDPIQKSVPGNMPNL